ncbi:MAG TPA: Ig-like domain-containing protein [Solirubrobacteraceae bacterium]
MRTRLAAPLLLLVLASASWSTSAAVAAQPVTLPGSPLSVSIGPLGQCQSSNAALSNDFYPPTGALGDCGFFLGFIESGNPPFLAKKVFGFEGVRGPGLAAQYTPVSQGTVTGSGSTSDPYALVTTYSVNDPTKAKEGDYALVRQTTTYVVGQGEFTSTFDVENLTGQAPLSGLSPAPATPLRFHAIYAGDLAIGGGAFATGLLLAGPPRLVGGQVEGAGAIGGLVEAAAPSPPWANYAAGCWNVVPEAAGCPATSAGDSGIWAAVRAAGGEGPVFNDTVDPNALDAGAGVSWDDHLNKPLKPGEHATYTIVNRASVPRPLAVAPAVQTVAVGQMATVLVTATDTTGAPYANRPIVYTIGNATPKTGSVLTGPTGVATISYTGTAIGADTVRMFLDLSASGESTASDPAATAQVVWAAAARSASSRFSLRSLRATRGGKVTIVIVPRQQGVARAGVTVPTASLALGRTHARRGLRCKHGEVALGARCRPRSTVSGKVTAPARAGAALKLVIAPSRSLAAALARGRKIALTVRIGYRSRLGGKPTNENVRLVVRGRRARLRHH